MPLLIASEASSLALLFALVFGGGDSCPGPSYVHGIWVSIERISPLCLRMSLVSWSPFESVVQLYVFFLMEVCRVGPVVPISRMVELYAVDH